MKNGFDHLSNNGTERAPSAHPKARVQSLLFEDKPPGHDNTEAFITTTTVDDMWHELGYLDVRRPFLVGLARLAVEPMGSHNGRRLWGNNLPDV